MAIRKPTEMEIKVGFFVSLGIALLMLAILMLGGSENLFRSQNTYVAHFPSVEGLINGAKVVLGGLRVGTVESVDFDADRKDIKIELKIARKYEEWIRKGSSVEILTQGVLGDKFISMTPGNQEDPILPTGSELPHRPTKDLSQFLSKGDQLMVNLNSIAGSLDRLIKSLEAENRGEVIFQGLATTAKNLSQASQKLNHELDQTQLRSAIRNLNSILEKINNGTGTLGVLINDPSLYYDAKSVVGGANRNRVIRNLVRKTIKDSEEAK
jgi:phospholipid/cholesterol/gamma-HCH transport system substrate-binding protein